MPSRTPDDEMTRMPSEPKTLAEASRSEFLSSLRLDYREPEHRRLYEEMKADAMRAHLRICDNRGDLVPHLRNDPSVRPPFTVCQITERALHREIRRIYAESTDTVREKYNLGAAPGQADGENWVVRWMLWQILLSGGDEAIPAEEPSSDRRRRPVSGRNSHAADGLSSKGPGLAGRTEPSSFWDPVRNA